MRRAGTIIFIILAIFLVVFLASRENGAYSRGRSLYASEQYREALSAFLRAREENPNDISISNDIAMTYLALGKPGRAAAVLEPAMKKNQEFSVGWVTLGTAYAFMERHREVIRCLSKVVPEYPRNAVIHRFLGIAYLETGQAEEAIPLLRRARIFRPGDRLAQIALGRAFLESGNPARAVKILTPLLSQNIPAESIDVLMGRAYSSLGQYSRAIPYLQRALQKDSGNPFLCVALGKAWRSLHEPEKAAEYFMRARRVFEEEGFSRNVELMDQALQELKK